MLRTLRCGVERWALATPFRISRGVKTEAEVVTVELTQGDARGRGEAVPYPRYGETADSVLAQINSVLGEVCAGASREELLSLLPHGAARNAIDCALWDLDARLTGKRPPDLKPRVLAPLPTAMTISLDRPPVMAAAAANAMLRGARLLKLKLDATEPDDCMREVRKVAPDVPLVVDANEGWNLKLLQDLQPLMRDLNIAFVEQPIPAGDDACLEGLSFQVPVCADESCHTSADLERLSKRYTMVNVKLDKAGGLTEALRLVAGARARNFGVMVGCMVCTSLAIAPAFHVAALADFVDLDGPLWLAKDRAGGVTLGRDGLLAPPDVALWGWGL